MRSDIPGPEDWNRNGGGGDESIEWAMKEGRKGLNLL